MSWAAPRPATGKTAGFTLPLLQRLSGYASTSTSPARHPIRAVILVPTRELAAQVAESVQTYGKHLPLRSAVVYGGVSIDPQLAELRRGVEILVATPGRLLDHVQQKTVNFSQVEILVLDEADRMLDMGFLPDITRILGLLPAKRQSLMFSATFSDDIKKLADRLLKEPILIEAERHNTAAETVTQIVHQVDMGRKRELLAHLIKSQDLKQVLVFCRTKQGAGKLAHQLDRDGIGATAIHGDKTQQQRTEALQAFKDGTVRVLVATDVAARGIDIDQLPYVVNFEIPHVPEDYVHRIGRTGRGGSTGTAISLVSEEELKLLDAIEKMLKRPIPSQTVPGFEASSAIVAHPEAESHSRSRHERGEPRERGDRGDRGGRGEHRPPRRGSSTVAADGFDFSKPYESKPHLPPVIEAAYPHVEKNDAKKPKKPLAALFMPPAPPKPTE